MSNSSRFFTYGRFVLLVMVALLFTACGGGGSTQTGQTPGAPATASSFTTTLKTTDGDYVIQFNVTPNRLGTNTFTVQVNDASSGKPDSHVTAQLSLTMLTMDMGTQTSPLQADGQGKFSAQGELSMNGKWEVRIILHSSNSALHEATVTLTTSA